MGCKICAFRHYTVVLTRTQERAGPQNLAAEGATGPRKRSGKKGCVRKRDTLESWQEHSPAAPTGSRAWCKTRPNLSGSKTEGGQFVRHSNSDTDRRWGICC